MKEDILQTLASLEEYFSVDKLKADFFRKASEYNEEKVDPDSVTSANIYVATNKFVTVSRDDIFIKEVRGRAGFYVPDKLQPEMELALNMLYFYLHVKEKESDVRAKLNVLMGYGRDFDLYYLDGFEVVD